MAHSLVMAGEVCPERQDVNQSQRNLRRLFSCPKCTIRSAENVSEEALMIAGANRFSRRGNTCRLHAIFMNQSCAIWGYQEELSSTAACSCKRQSLVEDSSSGKRKILRADIARTRSSVHTKSDRRIRRPTVRFRDTCTSSDVARLRIPFEASLRRSQPSE